MKAFSLGYITTDVSESDIEILSWKISITKLTGNLSMV